MSSAHSHCLRTYFSTTFQTADIQPVLAAEIFKTYHNRFNNNPGMKTEQNFKIMPINQYTKKHPSNKQEHIKSKQEYFIKI